MTTYSATLATATDRTSVSDHILELDGLRALAVWMVLLDHMVDGWRLPKEAVAWMPTPLWQFVSHGWLGVDLFFILSGFLITGILLDSRDKAKYFRNFYGRRVLRILPLYVTCIVIMYLCYGGPYFLLAILFSANVATVLNIQEPHGPGVFWSLAVEEHFYLIWPLAVRFLNRRALIMLGITIVLGSPILRWWAIGAGFDANGVYELSCYRFDGLALGALLAIWSRSDFFNRMGAVTLAGALTTTIVVVTAIAIPYGVFGTGSQAGIALRSTQAQFLFAAVFALALAFAGSRLTSPLRCGFARLSARLSYCLYLIHLAVGDLYYWVLRHLDIRELDLWGPVGALAMRSLVIIAFSFALAGISQKYLEGPFMKLRKHFA